MMKMDTQPLKTKNGYLAFLPLFKAQVLFLIQTRFDLLKELNVMNLKSLYMKDRDIKHNPPTGRKQSYIVRLAGV